MELAEFVRARLHEDEQAAVDGDEQRPERALRQVALGRRILADHARIALYRPEIIALYPDKPEMADDACCARCHILDPDHDYDEDRCEDLDWPCPELRLLAAIWNDHPDYQQQWQPE